MNELESLMVLAFSLNMMIGFFLFYAILVKSFKNRYYTVSLLTALALAILAGFVGIPLMTLFMTPFLGLGVIILYFSLHALIHTQNPSANFLSQLQSKWMPRSGNRLFTWVCWSALCAVITLLFLFLYPFN